MNTQTNVRMLTADPTSPFRAVAELGRVMSSPQRLRLLHLLCQCDRTVEDLAEVMSQPVANISHHLQLLKRTQLVVTRRLGRRIAYGLADEGVKTLWKGFRNVAAERLTEMRVLKGELASRRSKNGGIVDRKELLRLLKKGTAVLIDVRPRVEFEAGHIEGAISIPLDELMQRIKELPRNKTVVLYCRGPYCLMGDAAQEKLVAKSIPALRLEDGVVEWTMAGQAVQQSPDFKPLIERQEL